MNLIVDLIGIFFSLLGEIYVRIKHYLFLVIFIILLMIGFAIKYPLLIMTSLLLLIISIGSIRYKLEEKKNAKKIHKTGKDKLVESKKAK